MEEFLADYNQMNICNTCYDIHGPWHRVELEDDGTPTFVEELIQLCDCDRRSLRETEAERWDGFDFNTVLELCNCCGAEALRSGSRWSVWFCDDCKESVRALHSKYQRYIIPIGRHSLMGGFGLSGEAVTDKAEVEYSTIRWREISRSMEHLDKFAKLFVAMNLELLRLPRQTDVGLEEYLATLAENPVDKEEAFLLLCRFFEVKA